MPVFFNYCVIDDNSYKNTMKKIIGLSKTIFYTQKYFLYSSTTRPTALPLVPLVFLFFLCLLLQQI